MRMSIYASLRVCVSVCVLQMHNGGMVPALPLLHLALDVFISVAQPDASALSVHLVHGLLQEILEPQVLLTDRARKREKRPRENA
jgi:hypothetical protein